MFVGVFGMVSPPTFVRQRVALGRSPNMAMLRSVEALWLCSSGAIVGIVVFGGPMLAAETRDGPEEADIMGDQNSSRRVMNC